MARQLEIVKANPIYKMIEGSPFQPGNIIRVSSCCDEVGEGVDIPALIGHFGIVKYLEYECGSGQHFPEDPMIGVRFRDNYIQEFWKEELSLVSKKG